MKDNEFERRGNENTADSHGRCHIKALKSKLHLHKILNRITNEMRC